MLVGCFASIRTGNHDIDTEHRAEEET